MNSKQFQRFLDRDKGCYHCGETVAVAPNHRANRGMGGSKERDTPSNIVVLCSWLNGEIESSATMFHLAKHYGWKVSTWETPSDKPVFDFQTGLWYVLDDDYNRQALSKKETD